jgi:hypothetical protein
MTKAMLVKDGLQGVDDSVFLTGGCAYLLKVHTHLHLLGVFLHEFHNGTITKVRLNETQRCPVSYRLGVECHKGSYRNSRLG